MRGGRGAQWGRREREETEGERERKTAEDIQSVAEQNKRREEGKVESATGCYR